MLQILREAGWPIFLVLAFGATALLVSIRYAVAPDRRGLALCVGLGALTLLWGVVGTTLGLDQALRGLRDLEPDQKWIVWVGLREAMNNLSAALLLDILVAGFATVGAVRQASR